MPLVSGRQLAIALGLTEGAVRKAKASRLKDAVVRRDGKELFDLDKAKALYASETDPAMQRKPAATGEAAQPGVVVAPPATPQKRKPDYGESRAADMFERALINQLKRKKLQGASLDSAPTLAAVQTLSRMFRDAGLNFTDKYHQQIAADLGIEDSHRVFEVLDRYQRLHIETHMDKVRSELLK